MTPNAVGGEEQRGKGEGVRQLLARRKDPNLLFLAPTDIRLASHLCSQPISVCMMFKESSHRHEFVWVERRSVQRGWNFVLCNGIPPVHSY